jgi:hypothetical protein
MLNIALARHLSTVTPIRASAREPDPTASEVDNRTNSARRQRFM